MRELFGVKKNLNSMCQEGIYEIGLGMAGPVLMEYATDEQKTDMPPMAEGKKSIVNYSPEPSAGI